MLNYLTLIFSCQLAGELARVALDLPIPGPVLGMVLLFFFLVFKGGIPEQLSSVTGGLLNHLSLLFVPAGVGVMLHFKLLGSDWIAISIALVASTVLTIIVTAALMTYLTRGSSASNQTEE
ncbi:LrgA family protein [Roseibium sp. TrichSKD4]|uniref:CidA/LrgA family protein n=1 Tax=Roseibium sp. TrichSKD4 TaxID=744980 RepID=UPI0001E571F3|nr:CidA/LrgA family protein [Roseibium sp. TrichSKD4]EFO29662.1 LrgA family protein [Roseibium sp. TrichSKD4]